MHTTYKISLIVEDENNVGLEADNFDSCTRLEEEIHKAYEKYNVVYEEHLTVITLRVRNRREVEPLPEEAFEYPRPEEAYPEEDERPSGPYLYYEEKEKDDSSGSEEMSC